MGQRSIMAAGGLALGGGFLLSGLNTTSLLPGVALVGTGLVLGIPALRVLLSGGTFRVATGLPTAIAISGLLHLAFYGVDAFVPLALTSIRHQPVIVAALALTAASVCWTVGTWVQTRLARRLNPRLLVVSGLGLLTLGIIGMVVVFVLSVPASLAILAWALAGLGMGVAYATNALVVFETAPVGNEGTSTSIMQLANVLGIALGTGIGGALVARTDAATALLTDGIVIQQILMVFIIILALWMARRLPG
jgi:MFS family permease